MQAIEHLQQLNANLTRHHEDVLSQARSLIDLYWEYLHEENKRISQLHATGQVVGADVNINAIAPVIEMRGNKGYALRKPYIVWKKHSSRFRKNLKVKAQITGQPSISLHSYASLDVSGVLSKECTWNAPKALELETKLIQYRVLLNTLHELIKKTSATIRSLEKSNAKKMKDDTND
jgi:hypothetical protein